MERYLPLADIEPLTRRSYESKYEVHIRPLLGSIPLSKLDTETLDSFYAELRRCRKHCRGKAEIDHRTDVDHLCDEHPGDPCRPADPENCRPVGVRASHTFAAACPTRRFARSIGV